MILRTSWVYSADGANFLLSMLRLARERRLLRIVDDQHGSPTHAADIAAGIVTVARALARGEGAHGVFHIDGRRRDDLVRLCQGDLRCEREARRPLGPGRADHDGRVSDAGARPKNSRLDCTRIAEAYGIRLPDWRERVGQLGGGSACRGD